MTVPLSTVLSLRVFRVSRRGAQAMYTCSDLPAGGAGRVHRCPDVSPGTMYASYYS